jgi:hypothetical protein
MSWTFNEIKSTLKSVSDVLDPDIYHPKNQQAQQNSQRRAHRLFHGSFPPVSGQVMRDEILHIDHALLADLNQAAPGTIDIDDHRARSPSNC